MAAFQLILGGIALAWAWPLFMDPPFLGNGLLQEYSALRSINSGNGVALELLFALRSKLEWLFEQHSDGVIISLGAGLGLTISGVITGLVAIRLRRLVRPDGSARA